MTGGLALVPLDASRARDFHAVMQANAESAKCLCTAAYVEYWKDASLAPPCRARMLAEGRSDGFLLYRDGEPIGWCQAAPRDGLLNFVRGRGLAPDPAAYAIPCLVLVPSAKGRGLSHELLKLVLAELRHRGIARVQVFACRYGPGEDTSAFVELPESLCRRAGLVIEHDHPMRPIYRPALPPPP